MKALTEPKSFHIAHTVVRLSAVLGTRFRERNSAAGFEYLQYEPPVAMSKKTVIAAVIAIGVTAALASKKIRR